MRKAEVYLNGQLAGVLTQQNNKSYAFRYEDDWFANDMKPAISLTLPKTRQTHHNGHLFPFFFNMLSEGANRKLQCRRHKLDEYDHFGLLLAIAAYDTIGAITLKPIKANEPS